MNLKKCTPALLLTTVTEKYFSREICHLGSFKVIWALRPDLGLQSHKNNHNRTVIKIMK